MTATSADDALNHVNTSSRPSDLRITDIRLTHKSGGKSGTFEAA